MPDASQHACQVALCLLDHLGSVVSLALSHEETGCFPSLCLFSHQMLCLCATRVAWWTGERSGLGSFKAGLVRGPVGPALLLLGQVGGLSRASADVWTQSTSSMSGTPAGRHAFCHHHQDHAGQHQPSGPAWSARVAAFWSLLILRRHWK